MSIKKSVAQFFAGAVVLWILWTITRHVLPINVAIGVGELVVFSANAYLIYKFGVYVTEGVFHFHVSERLPKAKIAPEIKAKIKAEARNARAKRMTVAGAAVTKLFNLK